MNEARRNGKPKTYNYPLPFPCEVEKGECGFLSAGGDIPPSFAEVKLHCHSLISSVAEPSQSAPPEIIRLRRLRRWVKDIARETEN
jgi:hypothetical protein